MTDTVTPSNPSLTEEQSQTLAIAGILLSTLTALYLMFPFFALMTFRRMPDWSNGIMNVAFGAFGIFSCLRSMRHLRDGVPATDTRTLWRGIGLFSATAISFVAIMMSILIPVLSVGFAPSSMTFWTSEPTLGFLAAAAPFIGAVHKLSLIATVAGMAMIFSGLRNPH